MTMALINLSESEKMFIVRGIEENLRADGRGCLDYRLIELDTDVVSSCNGSAHIRLANTDILVGVKAEINTPNPACPNQGRIDFFVDCSANADPEFEGRGGEDIATELTSVLQRAYSSPRCLDLASLCLIPGDQVWVLYVDILILECGGSLLDAASLAVKAALFDTKIPSVTINYETEGKPEIDVSDDPYDVKTIDISHLPCVVTLCRVGHQFIVDASQEEEECTLSKLALAVTEMGTITTMRKFGAGSLHPESVMDILETGTKIGVALNKQLQEKLDMVQEMDTEHRGVLF